MTGWSFIAYGTPAPQGSKKYVGKGIMVESSKAVKPWREDVKQAALTAREHGAPCLDGPLLVRMVFTLRRPKSAPKRLTIPDRVPDLDKLLRSTSDAITTAGLWADDARCSDYVRLAKVWTGYDDDALPMPGVHVAAVQIEDIAACDYDLAKLWEADTLRLRGEVAV